MGVQRPYWPLQPSHSQENTQKMVSMACYPCHTPSRMLVEAYASLTMGTGPMFWDRQRIRVQCTECGVETATGLLLTHLSDQEWRGPGVTGGAPPSPGRTKLTRSIYINFCCGSGAQYKGDWVGRQTKPTSGFTLRTPMCGKNSDHGIE